MMPVMKRFAPKLISLILPLVAAFAPVSLSLLTLHVATNIATAAETVTCADGTTQTSVRACDNDGGVAAAQGSSVSASPAAASSDCVKLSVKINSSDSGEVCPSNGGNIIVAYLVEILKFLGLAFGGLILLLIIVSGVQYIASAGDPGAVKSAKSRITNAVTALVLYIFMYAILNFLIPGGIFI